jgi:hypothetical protein
MLFKNFFDMKKGKIRLKVKLKGTDGEVEGEIRVNSMADLAESSDGKGY